MDRKIILIEVEREAICICEKHKPYIKVEEAVEIASRRIGIILSAEERSELETNILNGNYREFFKV